MKLIKTPRPEPSLSLSLFPSALQSLKLSRSHVDWHSIDEVYLYSDAITSKISRTVTQRLGFSKGLCSQLWQRLADFY